MADKKQSKHNQLSSAYKKSEEATEKGKQNPKQQSLKCCYIVVGWRIIYGGWYELE